MYSAVLMLALTAGSETADFGRKGSSGCSGVVAGSCGGGVAHARHHGCTGTCGGVVVAPVRSHGCSGAVVGGCSGSAGHGCHGGGLFARLRERREHGCHGSCGGVVVGSCGGVVVGGCGGGIITPGAPVEKKTMPVGEPVPAPVEKKKVQAVAPATILVSVPAGARLIVDGTVTSSTSEQRTLITPALEIGTTYDYNMQVEVVRDGVTSAQSQQVNVRGGETTAVQFNFSTQGVASR